jgi:hypothetical protein
MHFDPKVSENGKKQKIYIKNFILNNLIRKSIKTRETWHQDLMQTYQ